MNENMKQLTELAMKELTRKLLEVNSDKIYTGSQPDLNFVVVFDSNEESIKLMRNSHGTYLDSDTQTLVNATCPRIFYLAQQLKAFYPTFKIELNIEVEVAI